MLKKDVEFHWEEEQENSFQNYKTKQKQKKVCIEAPVLKYYNVTFTSCPCHTKYDNQQDLKGDSWVFQGTPSEEVLSVTSPSCRDQSMIP